MLVDYKSSDLNGSLEIVDVSFKAGTESNRHFHEHANWQ